MVRKEITIRILKISSFRKLWRQTIWNGENVQENNIADGREQLHLSKKNSSLSIDFFIQIFIEWCLKEIHDLWQKWKLLQSEAAVAHK